MVQLPPAPARNAAGTRARILEAAQVAFAEKGYSQTGVREVAQGAGVASSLVIKYFGSKANLFREALVEEFAEVRYVQADKHDFAHKLVEAIADSERRLVVPAMMALSLGDAEARTVVEGVIREYILPVLSAWLGASDAAARAANLLMLSTGFAIFGRYLALDLSDAETTALRRTVEAQVAALLQAR